MTDAERQQGQYGLGYALAFLQQYDEARHIFEKLCREAIVQHDPYAEHRALHQVGMVERMAGNWTAAQRCFERGRELIVSLGGADLAVAVNAYEQGIVSLHLGQGDRARAWLDLSLACAERTGDLIAVGCAHRGLGDWFSAQDRVEEARDCWKAAHTSFLRAGDDNAALDITRRLDI